MDNILTLNNQNSVLTDEEIETLFKGFIKLVEKNTEQKLKNLNKNVNVQNNKLPKLDIKTVKDLEELKQTAVSIFEENKKLKCEIKNYENKILELRGMLVKRGETKYQ